MSNANIIGLAVGLASLTSLVAAASIWCVARRWKLKRALRHSKEPNQEPHMGNNVPVTSQVYPSSCPMWATEDVLIIGTPRHSIEQSVSQQTDNTRAPRLNVRFDIHPRSSDPFLDPASSRRYTASSSLSHVTRAASFEIDPSATSVNAFGDEQIHAPLESPLLSSPAHHLSLRDSSLVAQQGSSSYRWSVMPPLPSAATVRIPAIHKLPDQPGQHTDSGLRFQYESAAAGISTDTLDRPPAYTED
ncbi:uncharacterized protein C8Q71DRAFT_863164 [Rhodofomes roseus]|uniref:Uncharacterized protein n=1 Tax=Rhodofomes roseus TaxID=34475 RepID=A0ABQ8JZ62_9APHY|nr:uncharacterized protein C8Q71DRAFT_863164 [Rhodofomes roseus]KAH9829588.1 hypothetical protein C8Q71DRAFT_863164 [Rhodofomes roseus]